MTFSSAFYLLMDETKVSSQQLSRCFWWMEKTKRVMMHGYFLCSLLLFWLVKRNFAKVAHELHRHLNVMESVSLKKRLTFCDTTTGFPGKWRFRNETQNSLLMTRIWVVLLISRAVSNVLKSINKTLKGHHEPAIHWKYHPVTFFSGQKLLIIFFFDKMCAWEETFWSN